jgi:hypothetical protein
MLGYGWSYYISDLICSGIAVLTRDNTAYILYSRNLAQSLVRMFPDYKFYKLTVLETKVPEDMLKLRQKWWMLEYAFRGYIITNKRPPVRYRIKVKINKQFKVEVWLYTAHNTRTLLNTFDYMEDARIFALAESKKYLAELS